jgi:hypothetical protein
MKIIMVLMLAAVLAALGSAGVMMLRKGRTPGEADKSMARALALRVALSVALFLFMLLAWQMGWIRPNGIPVGP